MGGISTFQLELPHLSLHVAILVILERVQKDLRFVNRRFFFLLSTRFAERSRWPLLFIMKATSLKQVDIVLNLFFILKVTGKRIVLNHAKADDQDPVVNVANHLKGFQQVTRYFRTKWLCGLLIWAVWVRLIWMRLVVETRDVFGIYKFLR